MTSAPTTERPGLAGTGFDPRSPRNWLERVRDGGLDDGEHEATLRFVYRAWLVALLLKALGSGWDVAWHFRWLRDDFAPPHDVNLVGDGIAIALVIFHWYTRFGVDKWSLRVMTGGTALFVLSAPLDVINHRINGLDITSWSPTHFGLYVGTAIMIAGVILGWTRHGRARPDYQPVLFGLWFFFVENVWFPAQHQEYGEVTVRAWDAGRQVPEQELLEFAAQQIGRGVDREALVQFALPVPAWVYPVWTVAAVGLALLVARRVSGRPWTATALAGAYVAWRCVLYPLFAATGFPRSAVPFFVLGIGLAIDLVCRARLPWYAEAVLGAIVTTALGYAALYGQATALVAPPVSYRSAGTAAVLLALGWAAVRLLPTLRARQSPAPA